MTGEAYDHLMAVVVLGALFAAAVFVVPSLSYVNLLYLEQQQLRNVALSALKTMLFDEGYPANWGSRSGLSQFNENDVKRFGLALLSDPSLYVLDLDKVLRLTNDPMGKISYQKVRELLGLTSYGFSIVMRPIFRVDHGINVARSSNRQTATISFNVNVSRNDGQPVPNAIVYATIIYAVDKKSNDWETRKTEVRTYTDSLGKCTGARDVSITDGTIEDVIVLFKITVADRATLSVSSQDTRDPDSIAKINIVGDYVVLTMPENVSGSHDNRWITNIQMYNYETTVSMLNDTGTGNENKLNYGSTMVWNQSFPGLSASDPEVLIFTFRTELKPGGRQLAVLVGPYSLWSTKGLIEFNVVPPSSGTSVLVQRDVLVAGMAYTVELRLWKESV